jgi:hypothetical protein
MLLLDRCETEEIDLVKGVKLFKFAGRDHSFSVKSNT